MITNPVLIFLTVLTLILLGKVIFTRIRVPSIVGLIMAGIVVGPYGFGLLERDASFRILGDVGILYIMFQAAVEIDMFHLKAQLKSGVVYGLLSFLLPMLAGLLGTHYLLGGSWATSILVASMFASHTLITYPVVSKFGLQNDRPVVIAVCGTIVAVMLALLCLAGVVQYCTVGSYSPWNLVQLLLLTAVFMAVVGYVFPPVTRRFFKTTTDPVSQYIFIIALVLVSATIARLIGLEAILGAFYAGLVLNRMVPGRSPLMKNIRFIGDALFVPYFLIGVGMLINIRAVVEGLDVIWSALIMSSLALGSKWLAARVSQQVMGLRGVDRMVIFGLSGGKAAATIAAVMIGYQYALLDESMMNASVVMILVCCIVASVCTERGAKRLRIIKTSADLEKDTLEPVGFARQVVAVSNPLTAEGLTRLAIFMRKRANTNPMTVLFVRNNDDRRIAEMGRNAMEEAAGVADEMDVTADMVERFDINAVTGICNLAHERKATEIVIGMHRKSSVVDTFYGAFIDRLVSDCHRMVILSRCFIPVGTISRLVVIVPQNAEYETGFHMWVTRLAMLASNIEARITFMAREETCRLIASAIREDGIEVDALCRTITTWDDFILMSAGIDDADLLVLVTARKGSISYNTDLEQTTSYISRHFSRHNLMVVYPKQF